MQREAEGDEETDERDTVERKGQNEEYGGGEA